MVFISPYMDGYHFNNLSAPIVKEGNFGHYLFQMQVPGSGNYTIAISQKDKRCLPLSSTYNYGHTTVSIIQEAKDGGLKYLKGEKTWNRDAYVPFENEKLEKGKYWVVVKMQWTDEYDKFKNDMTLNINNYGCN